MPLRAALDDREWDKFDLDVDGKTIVRTSAKGTFSPSGLTIGGKITKVTVTDSSWVALPTTALINRNALSLQNRSGFDIAVNFVNTEAYADSWIVADGFELHYAIKDSIVIYAKAQSGAGSISILVKELA